MLKTSLYFTLGLMTFPAIAGEVKSELILEPYKPVATIIEFDSDEISNEQLANRQDPRKIKAIRSETFLAEGFFEFNKYKIKNLEYNVSQLKSLVQDALTHHYLVRIDAYTDELGNNKYNLGLSNKRAKSVASYLHEQFNLPYNQMITYGWGENYPVVNCHISKKLLRDNISKQQLISCLLPNRRVTISLIN